MREVAIALIWELRLARCQTIWEVTQVVRDYLACLSPAEVQCLPAPLRPRKLFDAQDVAEYALEIVRFHCEGPGHSTEVTGKLAEFLSSAASRAVAISPAANSDTVVQADAP